MILVSTNKIKLRYLTSCSFKNTANIHFTTNTMKVYKPVFISILISMTSAVVNAQWEMLKEDYVTEVFVHNDNIFVGTDEGNIYLSTDFGNNWTSIKNNLPDFYIDNIGIGEGNKLICSCGNSIYTSDNWFDWEKVYEVEPFQTSSNITTMAIEGSSIYVGAEFHGGIHASHDNGNTWNDISGNLTNKYITSVSVKDSSLFISVFGQAQVFRFDNTIMDWELFNDGIVGDQIFSMGKGNNFFAGGENSIFKLENEEWLPVLNQWSQILDFNNHSPYTLAAGNDVYCSSDDGLTWTTIETTYTEFQLKAVALYNDYILAGNFNGLYKHPLLHVSNSDKLIDEKLKIYPNPCENIFYLSDIPVQGGDIHINIIKPDGSVVQSKFFRADKQNKSFDVSSLASGLYIIQIIHKEFSVTRTIIIEKNR